MRDLLCAGIAVADTVVRPVAAMPPKGKMRLMQAIGWHPGGCAVNAAIAAARLGLRAGIAGAVGRDELGDFLARHLREEGVAVQGLTRTPRAQTSATAVLVSRGGERSFLHTVGASAEITERHVPDTLLARFRALHLSGFFLMRRLDGPPARRLLARAKRLRLVTSLDTCWAPNNRWRLLPPCLKFVDYFLPSLDEAAEVFGSRRPDTLARAALDAGVRRGVVLKAGARGGYALARGGAALRFPAARVRAVDTTGAGDTFDAGFLAGVLRGLSFEDSVRLGAAAGALSVAGLGAVGALRTYAQARRLAATTLRRRRASVRRAR